MLKHFIIYHGNNWSHYRLASRAQAEIIAKQFPDFIKIEEIKH
jgi:hypothetical protein